MTASSAEHVLTWLWDVVRFVVAVGGARPRRRDRAASGSYRVGDCVEAVPA